MKAPGKAGASAIEWAGLGVLGALAVWFVGASWRKWPDPIIDSGPQWYAVWRVSQGAAPYHDFDWYYGPLSLLFNGLLFRCFGPGMMVLATANLIVYTVILVLGYLAFRRARGPLAAFAAIAVFIAVFSFSMLNAVGNYNYALPYSNEATHGMLLALATAFVMTRWCGKPSNGAAFCLGLCGGLAAVLKPEFMLAAGVLGAAGLFLRYSQRLPVTAAEYGLLCAGVVVPTLFLTVYLAHGQSWSNAIVDACQAWWFVIFKRPGAVVEEESYMGYNHGWRNLLWETEAALTAALIIGAIWAAGWFVNRPWQPVVRWALALGAGLLACSVDMGGGFEIGPCFPGLIAVIFVILTTRVIRQIRRIRRIDESDLMALALVLLAGTMLARMALRARINHFGFIQAAFAGMVIAAFIVAEIPRWTGTRRLGQRVTLLGLLTMVVMACIPVIAESARNHATQTQSVGSGRDQFYAFNSKIDEMGALVNWCAGKMAAIPQTNTLLVLPEGVMINYLSRHPRPMRELGGDEAEYVKQLDQTQPDYIIGIWGDRRDGGIPRFGDPGQTGSEIRQWLEQNYVLEDTYRGHLKWAFIWRKKPAS